MPEIVAETQIAAPQDAVFRALTREDGIAGWWTDDTHVARGEVRLGFEGGAVVFRMRVTRSNAPEFLEWECTGDQPEWKGTKLSFVLRPTREGHTTLRFAHMGWQEATPYFTDCEQTWPKVLQRLKDYAETGTPNPLFT